MTLAIHSIEHDRADTIAAVRHRDGLTQRAMGEIMGVDGDTICTYEMRKREVSLPAWRNLQHYRVSVGDFD